MEIGATWPPAGLMPFNPFEVPLLNTLVLISSGVTVTWAHHALIAGNDSRFKRGLLVTLLLGGYFTALQGIEYVEASFGISDSSFGSAFYIATGFHGLHVLVGTSFLLACLIRSNNSHFRPTHHFGFEAAA